jgi:ATP-binding cassette subfamily B protein RaxB
VFGRVLDTFNTYGSRSGVIWTSEPRILVLEEATSHLDLARERCVNDAVRALALTRIIVAHRPETIASADRVIDLGGRSVQGRTPG